MDYLTDNTVYIDRRAI